MFNRTEQSNPASALEALIVERLPTSRKKNYVSQITLKYARVP